MCSPSAWGLATFPGMIDGCYSDCLLQRASYVRDTAFLLLCAPTSQHYPNYVSARTGSPHPHPGPPDHGGGCGACICTSPCITQRVERTRLLGHPHQPILASVKGFFIKQSGNKYVLNSYWELGTVLALGGALVSKAQVVPAPLELRV